MCRAMRGRAASDRHVCTPFDAEASHTRHVALTRCAGDVHCIVSPPPLTTFV
jgi:hypothetical protein